MGYLRSCKILSLYARRQVMMGLVEWWRECYGPSLGSEKPFLIDHLIEAGRRKLTMLNVLARRLWNEQEGQDIAEYAVMLAVILVIVVGTIRLIGSNANNVFSSVSSAIQ